MTYKNASIHNYTINNNKILDTWISRIKEYKTFAFNLEIDNENTLIANLTGIYLSTHTEESVYLPILPNTSVIKKKSIM